MMRCRLTRELTFFRDGDWETFPVGTPCVAVEREEITSPDERKDVVRSFERASKSGPHVVVRIDGKHRVLARDDVKIDRGVR